MHSAITFVTASAIRSALPWGAALVLLVPGCRNRDSDELLRRSDEAVAAEVPAAADHSSDSTAGMPLPRLDYRCLSGHAIAAVYDPEAQTAVLEYREETHYMEIAISASGARYIGDSLVWWTKGSGTGSTGTLYHLAPGFNTGSVIEECTAL